MIATGYDAAGVDHSAALRRYGCLVNQAGASGVTVPVGYVTEHPVYEVARRWSQFLRIIPRRQFVGYELDTSGRSVLWFRRYALGTGGNPSRVSIASGALGIRVGYEYVVDGTGYVDYAADRFYPGDHFVGQEGENDWTPSFEPGHAPIVYEVQRGILDQPGGADLFAGIVEQIAHEAPPGGFTNEWLLGAQFKPYHPSQSSLWKAPVIADYFPLHDPAAFYAPEISNDPALLWHVAYGQRVAGRYGGTLVSELPTGYRYCPVDVWWGQDYLNQRNGGDVDDWTDFARSARVYEPDLDIESAEAVTEGTTELVKVTLVARLHNTAHRPGGASSTIGRDVNGWDLDALANEPFATPENRIRRYLAHQATGRNFGPLLGDQAWNSVVDELPDNPYACIYPHFYLVRLMPEPYEDGNDAQDLSDTPVWHDPLALASLYLPVIGQGCVDQEQSVERMLQQVTESGVLPDTWGVHDYTDGAMYRQAVDGSWFGLMPASQTATLGAGLVRPDAPHGFAPPPGTRLSAEVYNRFVDAINLLNRYRLMVPYEVHAEQSLYVGRRDSAITDSISFTGNIRVWDDRVDAPRADTLFSGPTDLGVVTDATAFAECLLTVLENGGTVKVETGWSPFRWWIAFADGIEAAFPPIVAALADLTNVRVLVRRETSRKNERRSVVETAAEAEALDWEGSSFPGWWFGDDGYYLWDVGEVAETGVSTVVSVSLEAPSTVHPPALPDSDLALGRETGMPSGQFSRIGAAETAVVLSFVPGQTLVIEVPLAD